MSYIIERVAAEFNSNPDDVMKSSTEPLRSIRAMAIYVVKQATGLSNIQIGLVLYRDRTTIWAAVERQRTRIKTSAWHRQKVENLVADVTAVLFHEKNEAGG